MLRILVAFFFWLCAVGLLTLSIKAEINDSRKQVNTAVERRIEQGQRHHAGH